MCYPVPETRSNCSSCSDNRKWICCCDNSIDFAALELTDDLVLPQGEVLRSSYDFIGLKSVGWHVRIVKQGDRTDKGLFSDRYQMAGSWRTFRVNAEGCAEGCTRVGSFQAVWLACTNGAHNLSGSRSRTSLLYMSVRISKRSSNSPQSMPKRVETTEVSIGEVQTYLYSAMWWRHTHTSMGMNGIEWNE